MCVGSRLKVSFQIRTTTAPRPLCEPSHRRSLLPLLIGEGRVCVHDAHARQSSVDIVRLPRAASSLFSNGGCSDWILLNEEAILVPSILGTKTKV